MRIFRNNCLPAGRRPGAGTDVAEASGLPQCDVTLILGDQHHARLLAEPGGRPIDSFAPDGEGETPMRRSPVSPPRMVEAGVQKPSEWKGLPLRRHPAFVSQCPTCRSHPSRSKALRCTRPASPSSGTSRPDLTI